MDSLATFILTGEARAVDFWWADKGMGIDPEINTATGTPYHPSTVRTPPKPWSTDRGLRYVIEDRVREVATPDCATEYYRQICTIVHGRFWEDTPVWHGAYLHAEATNRQRILAAARAMGLEL